MILFFAKANRISQLFGLVKDCTFPIAHKAHLISDLKMLPFQIQIMQTEHQWYFFFIRLFVECIFFSLQFSNKKSQVMLRTWMKSKINKITRLNCV